MKKLLAAFVIVGLTVFTIIALEIRTMPTAQAADSAAEPMLAHNVFFTLKDKSPEAKTKLVAACKKYLAKHPGTTFFAAGTLAEDLKREVNDLDFDVGLHVIFKTKADHDRYQDAELHLKFIEENKANWSKVRVFDSKCDQ